MQGGSDGHLLPPAFAPLEALKAASVLIRLSQKHRPLSTKRWFPSLITIAETCRGTAFTKYRGDLPPAIHGAETVSGPWSGSDKQTRIVPPS
jgi:hypothetical protein